MNESVKNPVIVKSRSTNACSANAIWDRIMHVGELHRSVQDRFSKEYVNLRKSASSSICDCCPSAGLAELPVKLPVYNEKLPVKTQSHSGPSQVDNNNSLCVVMDAARKASTQTVATRQRISFDTSVITSAREVMLTSLSEMKTELNRLEAKKRNQSHMRVKEKRKPTSRSAQLSGDVGSVKCLGGVEPDDECATVTGSNSCSLQSHCAVTEEQIGDIDCSIDIKPTLHNNLTGNVECHAVTSLPTTEISRCASTQGTHMCVSSEANLVIEPNIQEDGINIGSGSSDLLFECEQRGKRWLIAEDKILLREQLHEEIQATEQRLLRLKRAMIELSTPCSTENAQPATSFLNVPNLGNKMTLAGQSDAKDVNLLSCNAPSNNNSPCGFLLSQTLPEPHTENSTKMSVPGNACMSKSCFLDNLSSKRHFVKHDNSVLSHTRKDIVCRYRLRRLSRCPSKMTHDCNGRVSQYGIPCDCGNTIKAATICTAQCMSDRKQGAVRRAASVIRSKYRLRKISASFSGNNSYVSSASGRNGAESETLPDQKNSCIMGRQCQESHSSGEHTPCQSSAREGVHMSMKDGARFLAKHTLSHPRTGRHSLLFQNPKMTGSNELMLSPCAKGLNITLF